MPAGIVALYLERLTPEESTPLTLTLQVALTVPVESDAVIVTVPALIPLTTPFLTAAIPVFEDVHFTAPPSERLAVSLQLAPALMD